LIESSDSPVFAQIIPKFPARMPVMSQITFNIADYRPTLRLQTHEAGREVKAHSGLVVVRSNVEHLRQETAWLDARPEVVDIRSVRDSHRNCPRRGKILRFSNPGSHRVYMMPAHDAGAPVDDDPGPMVA
jgi:hypothetical protein